MAGFPQPTGHRLRFGVFELDVCAGELHKNGWKVKLEGQPLALLALLLQRAGEMVSREEVRRLLWASDTYVDYEHSINAAVKRLRRALDDCARTPRFIETLPRRGYRFIYPVRETEAAGVAPGNAAKAEAASPAEPQRLLSIGKVAQRFGITANRLRLYEREGLLISLRDGNARRHFTAQDFGWIGTLLRLVREGKLNFAGIRRLLALLPCWQIRGCEHRRKQGCPFLQNAHAPCWVNREHCCASGESCYHCAVYRSAPECDNLKPLLAAASPAEQQYPGMAHPAPALSQGSGRRGFRDTKPGN